MRIRITPFSRITSKLFLSSLLMALVVAPSSFAQDDEEDDDIPDLPARAAPIADRPSVDDDDGEDEEDDEDDDDEDGDVDDPASTDGSDDAADDTEGTDAAAPAPAGDPPPADDGEDVETIYVIQGKSRLGGATFEITPQVLQSVNDRFTSHTGLGISGLYHLKENIAIQFSTGAFGWWDDPQLFARTFKLEDGPRLGGYDTDTTSELRDRERLQPELVKLYRLTWFTTADAQWSPISGKFSLHDAILGTFNVYLSVGAGVAGVQNPFAPDMAGPFDALTDNLGMKRAGPIQVTSTIAGGFRFYLFDWLGVRLEVRDYVQPLALLQSAAPRDADTSTFEVRNTILVQAGLSFILPAPWQK